MQSARRMTHYKAMRLWRAVADMVLPTRTFEGFGTESRSTRFRAAFDRSVYRRHHDTAEARAHLAELRRLIDRL